MPTAPLELTVVPKYKPPVPPAKARDVGGVFAVRSDDAHQKWGSLIGAVIAAGLGAAALYFGAEVGQGGPSGFGWIFAAGGALALLIAVAAVMQFIKVLRIEAVFQRAELLLSAWPVTPGSTVTARFHQQLKSGVTLNAVHGRLLIRERVRYRVGTDTHTATEETPIATFEPVPTDGDDGVVRADYTLEIPADAACSFKASDNELAWLLEVTVDAEGFPDAKSSFPIRVADGAIIQPEP